MSLLLKKLSSLFSSKTVEKDSLKDLLGNGLLENSQHKTTSFNPRSFLDLKVLADS